MLWCIWLFRVFNAIPISKEQRSVIHGRRSLSAAKGDVPLNRSGTPWRLQFEVNREWLRAVTWFLFIPDLWFSKDHWEHFLSKGSRTERIDIVFTPDLALNILVTRRENRRGRKVQCNANTKVRPISNHRKKKSVQQKKKRESPSKGFVRFFCFFFFLLLNQLLDFVFGFSREDHDGSNHLSRLGVIGQESASE